MLLKFTDFEKECSLFKYEKEHNVFLIQDSEEETICEYYPVLNLDPTYNPRNFQLLILHNEREDYSENSIFEVYVGTQRIGWIFPFQALLSNQHDYCDNKFFLRYAFVACFLLIDKIKEQNQRGISTEIFLEDFYDDAISILLVDNENISKLENFDMNDYTVSLYQKGYSYVGNGNLDSEIIQPNKRLKLQPISDKLRDIKYIHSLFGKEIPKNHEAFAKFHMYYQIVEILISAVFEDKFKKFVSELNENVSLLFDKRDELSNMVLEKQRVKWLFANYVNVSQEDKNILDERCKKLLQVNNKKTGDSMPDNLYSVRCLLVHNMYILNEYSHQLLDDLDKAFLEVIMEMLLSFHIS